MTKLKDRTSHRLRKVRNDSRACPKLWGLGLFRCLVSSAAIPAEKWTGIASFRPSVREISALDLARRDQSVFIWCILLDRVLLEDGHIIQVRLGDRAEGYYNPEVADRPAIRAEL